MLGKEVSMPLGIAPSAMQKMAHEDGEIGTATDPIRFLQIEALPSVVKAVRDRLEVYLDSGVRTGTDVIKALALGAKGVFVGRPALWGLAYNGTDGVSKMLNIFKTEINRTLALMGHSSVYTLRPQDVIRQERYGLL
ncbi:hypothetical protein V5799_018109 [Amblyomma americanum]|uniref:FMN hydroxy acid dehydrogenase domain-containing protein n=1 Tax=Amblyomma americanum TaxID=6943 RepID=A0AAQ4F0Q2_AMBAM